MIFREHSRWYELKPHPVQIELINAISNGVRFPVVPAGRRCLEAGTLVSTPTGPIPIEMLNVGDQVIGFNGVYPEVTTISEVHNNGRQLVYPLMSSNHKYLAATENHKLYACNESDFDKREGRKIKGYFETEVSDINKRIRVRRCYFGDLIGSEGKNIEFSYALGALLGDGCSRDNKITTGQYHRNINISADNETIPSYIASLLGCEYKKCSGYNFTYSIRYGVGVVNVIPFYKEWCSGRYAHEKIADWEEIDTWSRESALMFLAGIIDTDGSIYYKNRKKTEAIINIGMQSKSIVECCAKIIFKFFQERMAMHVDKREKYVNGHVYYARTTSNIQLINILKGINKYLVRKKDFDTSSLVSKNILEDRIGFVKGDPYIADTYDITVSNDTNLYCLHEGGIVTHNSGKTERFKRFLVKEAMKNPGEMYFAAAPTRDQAKKIFWNDLKTLSFANHMPKKPSETELKIFFPNETSITVVGLDEPARFEGVAWTGGGIDEFGNLKDGAWEENIMPALDTVDPRRPDYRAWCWIFGVPEGLNHYYDRYDYAITGNDPLWKAFHWKSSEILPQDVIDSAKRILSPRQFRQEYEASFESAEGRIYEDYSTDNTTQETIHAHEQLLWHHDFNFTPMSSGIAVRRENSIFILDEIVLSSATSRQSAIEFCERYKNHQNKHVVIYGDPAGRAGEKHGHASDYTEMENYLRSKSWTLTRKVKSAAPSIKDRQNAVRAKILNAAGERTLFVNPSKCPYSHRGLATVQFKKGSSFLEEDSDYQHITTAIGYMIDYEFPINGKTTQVKLGGIL